MIRDQSGRKTRVKVSFLDWSAIRSFADAVNRAAAVAPDVAAEQEPDQDTDTAAWNARTGLAWLRKQLAKSEVGHRFAGFDDVLRWNDAADRLGMTVKETSSIGGRPTELRGHVDGYLVTVTNHRGEELGESFTDYAIQLNDETPVDVVRPRTIRATWRARVFRSADPEWDRRFVVQSSSPDRANEYLTAERRAVFEQIHRNEQGNWRLKEQSLEVPRSGYPPGEEVLQTVRMIVGYADWITKGHIPAE